MPTVPTCNVTLVITDDLGNPISGVVVKYWPATDPDLVHGASWSIAQYQVNARTTDATGSVTLPLPQSASGNPTTQQYVIEPQMTPYTKWAGVVPPLSAVAFSDLVLAYGWTVLGNSAVSTAIQTWDTTSIRNQLIYPGYQGGADTVTTTFNGDGSIAIQYATPGVTDTITFNADGSIVESFTGTVTHTKTTTFSGSAITETVS